MVFYICRGRYCTTIVVPRSPSGDGQEGDQDLCSELPLPDIGCIYW